ncbi:taurine ABC transporter ATPase, partial [Burkholderia multivorans]
MDRTTLAQALETGRITGEVATPRENNLDHIRRFLTGERQFDFGVALTREWDFDSVFALMVDRAGLRPDPAFTSGVDTIST